MSVKYFVDENLIPNDGSKEILNVFNKNIDFSHTEIYIYPDVHYKSGARVVNGMLIKSKQHIYPACLGVENCGFTFGKIKNSSIEELQESFKKYSQNLKDYGAYDNYSWDYIYNLFITHLKNDFEKRPEFYEFLDIKTIDQAIQKTNNAFTKDIKYRAISGLCSLGGGNHFFEVHQVVEDIKENSEFKTGDFVFILHTDSIGVGDIINLRYSNLSEWDYLKGWNAQKQKLKFKIKQCLHFLKIDCFFTTPLETLKLLFSQKDYRTIKANSSIGKNLLFEHNLASFFGEMNRDLIIQNWATENNIKIEKISSHNHCSVEYQDEYIFQRNGVQYVGNDKYLFLPSAMGNYSYIMENSYNKDAFYTTNHGVGRLQDKHIARGNFTDDGTIKDLESKSICLYRVGRGKLAEQNLNAFKDIKIIIDEMQKQNLATPVVKTKPIAIIKG